MKSLQIEFQSNSDMCGLHKFQQIRRSDNAAIYSRTRVKEGTVHSYEAFRIKLVPKGAKLPGGLTVQEDYESYPGSASFGKTAYSCKTLAAAEARFDEIEKKAFDKLNPVEDIAEDATPESDVPKVAGKRGRKAIDRSTINIPKDKFTIKSISLLNPTVSSGFLYLHIQTLIQTGSVKIDGTMPSARGKATVIYSAT